MWELQVAAGAAKQLPSKASAAGYFPCFCYGSQIFLFFGMKGFWMIHWKSSFDDVRSKHIFLEIDKLPKSFSIVHVGGQNMNQIHQDLSLCTATLVRASIPQPRKLCVCVFLLKKSGLCRDVPKKKAPAMWRYSIWMSCSVLCLLVFFPFALGVCVVLWRSGLQQVHEGWGGTSCLCQFGYHSRDFSIQGLPLTIQGNARHTWRHWKY